MKNSKRILCFLLVGLIVSMTFWYLTVAETLNDYIIWEANSDLIASETNYVDASEGQISENKIEKKYDLSGGFYRAVFSLKDSKNDDPQIIAKTSINSSVTRFGWMNNKNVLNKIEKYIKVSFQYRFSSNGEIPADAKISLYSANENNAKVAKLITVPVSSASDWQTVDYTDIQGSFTSKWQDGCFSISLFSESSEFSGHQILDVRGLCLVVSGSDQAKINADLKTVTNITKIQNFTQGVQLPIYQGNKNYFSLFTKYDETSSYSKRDNENSFVINLDECDNCTASLLRTRAKGKTDNTAGTTVTIDVCLAGGYNVDEVIITPANGESFSAVTSIRNQKYSFEMPSSNVSVKVKTKVRILSDLALLWQMKAGKSPTVATPWYYGYSWPAVYTLKPGEDEAVYSFQSLQNSGQITLYGIKNSEEYISDYFDTAVMSVRMRTQNVESARNLNLAADNSTVFKNLTLSDEWQEFTFPLKEVASKPDFSFFVVSFSGYNEGEIFEIGSIYIWSRDTGKTNTENFEKIMDISNYEKSLTNEVLGIIGYYGRGNFPWDEFGSGYVMRDAAWYDSFRDEVPYVFGGIQENEINPYQMCIYNASLPGVIDLTEYENTGYLEFYIKTSSKKATIPFTLQTHVTERKWVPFEVEYDVKKARPDGYMCVRIPYTYFKSFGAELGYVSIIAITGCQELPEQIYTSPFRFYTNYADIEDLSTVPEKEPLEERAIPIELDSDVINAELDKDNMELLVPEKAYLWELLSAITPDDKDVTVKFIENDEILIDENEIIKEAMELIVFRRDIQVASFDIYYLIEE